jgi:hypothetical protein
MIKKTTRAVFSDGAYQGKYDWNGGIPLSKGEEITITLADGSDVLYKVSDKLTTLHTGSDDQSVSITYYLDTV